eukprot:COSAG01_NODE_1868_length_9028_cov_3.001232_2_plen_115_part_00
MAPLALHRLSAECDDTIHAGAGAVKGVAFGHHSEYCCAIGGEGARILLFDIRMADGSHDGPSPLTHCIPSRRLQSWGSSSSSSSVSISGLQVMVDSEPPTLWLVALLMVLSACL